MCYYANNKNGAIRLISKHLKDPVGSIKTGTEWKANYSNNICLCLPIKLMASGKNCERFWLQWSEMGICLYLNSPAFSNMLGRLGVTFKMYLMPNSSRISRFVESFAQPRYRCGRISTGNEGWGLERGLPSESVALIGSRSMSDSMSEESELIRSPPRPRTWEGGELLQEEPSRFVSHIVGNSAWNLLKPPVKFKSEIHLKIMP